MVAVVDKVNLINGNVQVYPKPKSSSDGITVNTVSSNANSKKRVKRPKQADSVSVVSKSIVAPARSAPDVQKFGTGTPVARARKQECRLCNGPHHTRLCGKFVEVDERKKAFYDTYSMNPCEV